MKIKVCSKTYTTTRGMTPEYPLSPGKEYEVIQIDVLLDQSEDERIYFRVLDDEDMISYVPIVLCSITADEIFNNDQFNIEVPEGWVVETQESGNKTLLPLEFSRRHYRGQYSFWEDYYNGEGEAEKLVWAKLKKLFPNKYEHIL